MIQSDRMNDLQDIGLQIIDNRKFLNSEYSVIEYEYDYSKCNFDEKSYSSKSHPIRGDEVRRHVSFLTIFETF